MANNRAFSYKIGAHGSGAGEDGRVHQSSPAWVLTFVRWENRDTKRVQTVPFSDVREPMVIENDCVQVNTISNKGVMTPSMNAVLKQTDVNYMTAIAPGDFVFVNILNWESDARRVADQARAKKPINGPKDGFKGVFKIQGVRKIINTDPNSGAKTVFFRIDGFAFTEFNNTIYFNPYLLDSGDSKNLLLFVNNLTSTWSNLINSSGYKNIQDILCVLIQCFIGTGVDDKGRMSPKGSVLSPNVHFFIPSLVGALLGVPSAKAAKDIYSYLFGIQSYAAGSVQTLASGMNPTGLSKTAGRFNYTPTPCQGETLLKPEFWNQVKAWSILQQYTNSPLNELYTCFRISPNNSVMPTLVFRQIPFTNEDFSTRTKLNATVTPFMTVPRWAIDPAMVLIADLGREEAARVNFVQYYGRIGLDDKGAGVSIETARGNYDYDVDDVKRSGLRPYIVSTGFDPASIVSTSYKSPTWAKVVGDALIGGHLKINGTLTCAGITEPIAVGDNADFDGVVYHLEQVSHSGSYSPENGMRMFRTILSLSNGISKDSNASSVRYSEMTHPDAYGSREDDYNNNQILPGVSESQDVVYRSKDLDLPHSGGKSFPQPTKGVPVITKRKK